MPRDPLAILARVKALDLRAAQRGLAEARSAQATAEGQAAAADAMLHNEPPALATPTYDAFLAHGLAERDRLAAEAASRAAASEAAREAVALARGAEKVVAILRERRAAARRREMLRRAQLRLEDALPRDAPGTPRRGA